MLQIRANVFETNSSSTHTLNISKKPVDSVPAYIDFHFGEFGWDGPDTDFADYLYTAIYDCCEVGNKEQEALRDARLEKIRNLLDKYGVMYSFEKPSYTIGETYTWFDAGYVDHSYLLDSEGTLDLILNHEDTLARALFRPESIIHIGNDNDGYGVASEDEDEFDVFEKWN